jgi:hypothetical protein
LPHRLFNDWKKQHITTTNLAWQNSFAIDLFNDWKNINKRPQTLDFSLLFETAMIRAIYKVGTTTIQVAGV